MSKRFVVFGLIVKGSIKNSMFLTHVNGVTVGLSVREAVCHVPRGGEIAAASRPARTDSSQITQSR